MQIWYLCVICLDDATHGYDDNKPRESPDAEIGEMRLMAWLACLPHRTYLTAKFGSRFLRISIVCGFPKGRAIYYIRVSLAFSLIFPGKSSHHARSSKFGGCWGPVRGSRIGGDPLLNQRYRVEERKFAAALNRTICCAHLSHQKRSVPLI